MLRLTMRLVSDFEGYSLLETNFWHPAWTGPRTAIRGCQGPAGIGTFQWTRAVRAMSQLLVKQALTGCRRGRGGESPMPALLSGYAGSLAASLDYALSKQPQWLHDMFGTTSRGDSVARLIFRRMNPERKRPGPVQVFVGNAEFRVEVAVDNARAGEAGLLEKIASALDGADLDGQEAGQHFKIAVNG